jgi:hypothetical protein
VPRHLSVAITERSVELYFLFVVGVADVSAEYLLFDIVINNDVLLQMRISFKHHEDGLVGEDLVDTRQGWVLWRGILKPESRVRGIGDLQKECKFVWIYIIHFYITLLD